MKTEQKKIENTVTDMFGNEIIDGMKITIPADLAEEYGADDTDKAEDFIGEDE